MIWDMAVPPVRCSMFDFNRNRDRFLPDRHHDQYYLYSIHNDRFNHEYICSSDHNCNEPDFLEPFECQRRQEIQYQAFYQMQSYMFQEKQNGGHLLQTLWNASGGRTPYRYYEPDTAEWPVRMVNQRHFARKSNYPKTLVADMLLDMPNLSTDWMTKILDWSSTGYLTAAIESSIHLWSSRTQSVQCTINVTHVDADETTQPPNDSVKTMVTSLKWDLRGEKLAYSYTVERTGPLRDASMSTPTTVIDSNTSADTLDHLHSEWDTRSILANDSNNMSPPSIDDDTRQSNNVNFDSYIKVWLLNVQGDDSNNNEQNTSMCGCENDCNAVHQSIMKCFVVVMDWLANGRVLVVGCTRSRVTFFKYDCHQRRLIILRVMKAVDLDDRAWCSSLISCLHLSRDVNTRHLAVAVVSSRRCVLKVWRIENSLDDHQQRYGGITDQNDQNSSINWTTQFIDRYYSDIKNGTRWVIKAFAWHPWKHSLMCYAVTSVNRNPLPVVSPSWYVLANACIGQVVKRVNQSTAYISCPSVRMLSVDTHSMTFNRVTGELLVSATSKYRVQRNSGVTIEEKHSIVVMHALNRIFEMMNSSRTKKGMFFAWSPDGLRLALTNSDESLRIWNFWPTIVQRKFNCPSRDPITSIISPETSVQLTDVGDLNTSRFGGRKHNNYYFKSNHLAMSELSLDASRVIK